MSGTRNLVPREVDKQPANPLIKQWTHLRPPRATLVYPSTRDDILKKILNLRSVSCRTIFGTGGYIYLSITALWLGPVYTLLNRARLKLCRSSQFTVNLISMPYRTPLHDAALPVPTLMRATTRLRPAT